MEEPRMAVMRWFRRLRWAWARFRYGLRLERVEGMEFEYVLRSTRLLSKRDFDRVLAAWDGVALDVVEREL